MAAENGKMKIIIDDETYTAETPEWMLDKTAREMKAQLSNADKRLEGILKILSKKYDESKTFNEVKEELKKIKDNTDPANNNDGNNSKGREEEEKATKRVTKSMFSFEHAAIRSTKTLTRFVSVTATAAAAVGAFTFSTITSLGEQLETLTRRGTGLDGNQEDLGLSALDAARQMGALGVSTSDAFSMMDRYNRAITTGGRPAMLALTEAITAGDRHISRLGITTAEAADTVMRAAQNRSQVVDLENVNSRRLAEGTFRLTEMQRLYSSALGVSSDELEQFAHSLTVGNQVFVSSIFRFSDSIRNDAVQGVQEFATKMSALGGEAGAEIANSMIDAASMGGLGFSDSMVGVITAVPRLSGALNQMTADFRRQDFSRMDDYADQVASTLGNLTDSEKQRIFALARTGDQYARQMAQAVINFEQTEDRINELNDQLGSGLNMDRIQQGTAEMQSALGELGGMFSSLRLSFAQAFASGAALEALKGAVEAVREAFQEIFGVTDAGAREFSDSLSESLAPAIRSAGQLVASFVRFIPTLIKVFEGVAAVMSVLGTAIKIGVDVLSFAFNLLKPVINLLIGSFNLIATGANQVAQGFGGLWNTLGGLIAAVGNVAGSVFDAVQPLISSVIMLTNPFAILSRTVVNTAEFISGVFNPVESAVDSTSKALDKVSNFAKSTFTPVKPVVDSVTGAFAQLRSATGTLFQPVTQALGALRTGIDRVVEFFEPLTTVAAQAQEGITGFSGGLAKFVLGAGGVVLFGGLAVAMVTAFQVTVLPALTAAAASISAIGRGLGRGVRRGQALVAEGIGRATGRGAGGGEAFLRDRAASRRAGRAAAASVPGTEQDRRAGDRGRRRGRRGGGITRMANNATRALTAVAKAGAAFSKAMIAAAPGIAIATAAILGIAAALRIATPAIKALVPLGVKLAEVLGGVLTTAVLAVADVAKTFVETVGNVLTAAMENTFRTFELLLSVDPAQLFQAASGIAAIGVAMASLGAGQAAQGVGSFIGNLFGGDVLGRMMQLAGLAPQLEVVESVFNNFGNTIANFNSAVDAMNADNFVNEATRVAASIKEVKGELSEFGTVDMVKLALIGGSRAQPQSPQQPSVVENNTTNTETTVQEAPTANAEPTTTPVESSAAPIGPDRSEELLERTVSLLEEIRRYTRNSARSLSDR